MAIHTVAHINFRSQARAALTFYQAVFGGRLTLLTYSQAHNVRDPGDADLIMWGQVESEDGFRVMAYDVPADTGWHPGENAFFVSVRSDTEADIRALWGKLSDGATIVHALAPAPWTPAYGMLKDRFGVTWVMDVANGHEPG